MIAGIHPLRFRFAAILLIMLLLISCNREKRYVIPEKKFVPFMVDLQIAAAIGTESKGGIDQIYHIDSATLYGSVFKKHGITRNMFDSTMLYYSQRPEKFQRLYNEITARLRHMEDDLTGQQKKEETEKAEILWQSDSVYVFRGGKDRIEINVPIHSPGFYSVSATVKILPDDRSLDPRMTLYFHGDNGTPDGKRLRFPDIRYILRNGKPRTYRAVKQLDDTVFTSIRGFMANFSNIDSTFKRNMVVSEIKVSYRK